MSLLFCGIFAGLFVVLFVLLIILAVKRKFNKYDVIKYLLGVLLPVFIVTGALFPFALRDFFTDNIPYTLVNDVFYGYVKGDKNKTVEIFKYPTYHNGSAHAPEYRPTYFDVAKRSKFEAYLQTVETYSGVEETETYRIIKFEYQGEVWTLINRRDEPSTYCWNHYPEGKRPLPERGFFGDERWNPLFSYGVIEIEDNEDTEGRITFEVADAETFESYLKSQLTYGGCDEAPDGNKYIRFIEGGKMWTLVRLKSYEKRYCWIPDLMSSSDRDKLIEI